jgi:hypothetical protein
MKEIAVFEAWTDRMMEGTWELPETPEQLNQLRQLLSQSLTVGVDAMDATEQLGGLVGDDELFDRLTDLADRDPNANAWDDSAVMDRMWELADSSPELAAALTQIGTPVGPEDDEQTAMADANDQLDEIGDTPKGQAALRAVDARGTTAMDTWNKKPESGYTKAPKQTTKQFVGAMNADRRLRGFGTDASAKGRAQRQIDHEKRMQAQQQGVAEGISERTDFDLELERLRELLGR